MGRNKKIGLSYFPFEIDFFSDLKIRKLIKYQGGKAVVVYALLLCNIYKEGYYMRWDEELPFSMSEQTGFEEAYIREVIKCCMVIGLLSKELFNSDKILTSKGIQERFENICKLAKRKFIISEFNLISSEEIDINSEEIVVSSEETQLNSEESTQSKEKKSKVKKKEGNIPPTVPRVETRDVFENFKDEMLSDDFWIEQQAMTSGIGNKFTNVVSVELTKFFSWIVSTGNEETIKTLNDAKRRFFYWWRDHGKQEFEKDQMLTGVNTSRVSLGPGVWLENGKKFYGSRDNPREIPLNAPYRPSQDAKWDATNERWTISGG